MNKDEINKGLAAVFGAMLGQATEKAQAHPLYKALIETPELFKDPRNLRYGLTYDLDNAIKEAIKTINLGGDDEYADVFMDHQFYENHIEKLCTQFEGSFACADKSGVIVGRYINYLRTGELGKWEVGETVKANGHDIKCYWLPNFGTQAQWHEFIKGLYHFKYGNPQKYLLAYKALNDAGIEARKQREGESQ